MVPRSTAKRKVALLGAFDRYNYGDLLFPILTRNAFSEHSPEADVAIHALVESDLSRFGAASTQSLRALRRRGALRQGDTVVFAGGGTIGTGWVGAHSNLLGRAGNLQIYYLVRLLGKASANTLCRLYLGGAAPFPWVAGPDEFPAAVNVAYNAVGGSEFANLAPQVQDRVLTRLRKAAYLSVRDARTKELLVPVEDQVPVELAPDSAVIMSEQFPVDWLEERASPSVREVLDAGPYVCFQCHISYARPRIEPIVAALEGIHEAHGLAAVLLPIGRHVGLDDHVALRAVAEKLRTPNAVIDDDTSIWDIMLAIARAHLFIGTSLHGNVTSQSFAIPHVGLSERPSKLDYYLDTWDLPEQARCASLENIGAQVADVLAVPAAAREERRSDLIARAYDNFGKMARACGLEWR